VKRALTVIKHDQRVTNVDYSLLLLDCLDTIEIRSHRVVLERVHPFEELNEKKFRKLFDFQSMQYCTFCLRHGKSHSQQLQLIPNTDDSLTMY